MASGFSASLWVRAGKDEDGCYKKGKKSFIYVYCHFVYSVFIFILVLVILLWFKKKKIFFYLFFFFISVVILILELKFVLVSCQGNIFKKIKFVLCFVFCLIWAFFQLWTIICNCFSLSLVMLFSNYLFIYIVLKNYFYLGLRNFSTSTYLIQLVTKATF